MKIQINHQTVLTNDNMNTKDDDSFYMAVCAYVEQYSKTGDPLQSLQDWLSGGDYSDNPTVDATITEWDAEREDEDATERANEELDALEAEAYKNTPTGKTFREWYDEQLDKYDNVEVVGHATYWGIDYVKINDGQTEWVTTESDWQAALATSINDTSASENDSAEIYGALCGLCTNVTTEAVIKAFDAE